ncbi:MAG: FHA domain-containing protein [Deltaproteobacteria bacterium]|nr:FHA domain-containing protein [Deltaproteobacteria bacterium]
MPKLVLKFKDAILKEISLDKDTIAIGRVDDNDIKIDNMAVSGHHAKLIRENGDFVLIDLGSLNGTYVNGKKVSKWILRHNDLITIAKHSLTFQDERAPAESTFASTAEMKSPVGTVMLDMKTKQQLLEEAEAHKPQDEPVHTIGAVTFISGGDDQIDFDLSKRITVLGKGSDVDIRVKGFFVAKTAAVISRRGSGYFISHSEGRAVPKVNGESIYKGQVKLKDGDIIEIGGTKMQFYFKSPGD